MWALEFLPCTFFICGVQLHRHHSPILSQSGNLFSELGWIRVQIFQIGFFNVLCVTFTGQYYASLSE